MKQNASALAAAISATLGAASAQAATFVLNLDTVQTFSGSGASSGNLTSSTATWSYDDVTGLLTQTGGTFNVRFTITPTTTLFRTLATGVVLGNGAAATAATYVCSEGNFGGNVGASLCGNYNFGSNFGDESTATWGPGTATSRTIGGDDMALGPQQSLAAFDGLTEVTFVGGTLTLSNASCNPFAPGNASGCATLGGNVNAGQTWVLSVPAPVANPDTDTTTRNVAKLVPVLANDENITDPVTITADGTGTNVQAGATIGVTGSGGPGSGVQVTYTPNVAAGVAGSIFDTFTYTANGETTTVTMEIINTVPTAVGGDLSAISTVGVEPLNLTGTFTAPGTGGSLGDAGTAAVTAQGTKGTAAVAGNTITYTVTDAAFFTGTDSFTYSISDPDGAGPAETSGPVTVNVAIADAAPTLTNVTAQTTIDTPVDVDLVFTAGNGSPAQHTFAQVTDAASGSCVLNGVTVTYTPNAGFTGTDSCEYSLTDADGDDPSDTANATVSITVTGGSTGLREGDGGSSADWLILSLLGGSALVRRRRRRA